MREVQMDTELVAYCGLYCGACGAYLKERCPGCHKNEKATWCAVRKCCMENNLASCADCREFGDPVMCKKYNNVISRIIGFVLRSNRAGCIRQIKDLGLAEHAKKMTELRAHTIRR